MNTAPIVQRIATRPVEEDGLLSFVQREAHPVLQALLRLVNRATTNTSTVTTASMTTDPQADLVLADAAAGNLILALPSPYDWVKRQVIVKTDASANTVTVTGLASGPVVLASQWATAEVMADGDALYGVTSAISLGGDVTGVPTANTVERVDGVPFDLTTVPPALGNVLSFDGAAYVPGAPSVTITMISDVALGLVYATARGMLQQ